MDARMIECLRHMLTLLLIAVGGKCGLRLVHHNFREA
jgi:hypothetical protein